MMRRQLLRSTRRLAQARPAKQQQSNAFSTTTRRAAEVELTVDGMKVKIEGRLYTYTTDYEALSGLM